MTAPSPAENLAWWDERARLHGHDDVYDTDAVVAGASTLYQVDHGVVGAVTGLDLLHLQCHIGLDTVSWVREGAQSALGVDFSPVAVAKATAIAAAAGVTDRVQFIAADVLDLPAPLHNGFDVCYASRGVFTWVSDLTRWMQQAALTLRPGGILAVTDLHPLYLMCGGVDPLQLDFPYADTGPIRQDDQTSYVEGADGTVNNVTVEYAHSLGEIVTAAVTAGLAVE